MSRKMSALKKILLLSSKVKKLKKLRNQHMLKKLLLLRSKQIQLISCISDRRAAPKLWTLVRSKSFWEHDVQQNDSVYFKENFRMTRESFEALCEEVKSISKKDTKFRKCIDLKKRVAISLYALGSSAEYRTVGNLFGVSKSTVCKIVIEFCNELWEVLRNKYLNVFPLTREKLDENVEGFRKLGLPQCFGAIDGTHIEIKPHAADALDYHNYKGWYSTVLLALVDYRYRFLYINVGSPGRCNDSSIYETSALKLELDNSLMRDMSKTLCNVDVPVYIIGDSAFKFTPNLMKPYPFNVEANPREKTFNYTLSKCRRVVENAFGHLKARFRRIGKGIDNSLNNAPLIIKACCALHNFLNDRNDNINNRWLEEMQNSDKSRSREQPQTENRAYDNDRVAETIRKALSEYISIGTSSSSTSIVPAEELNESSRLVDADGEAEYDIDSEN